MSRREDRSSDGRRRRISGFDRDAPSPKRSRRDDNVEIGGARAENVSDKDHSVRNEKQHRRDEDVKPLEASLVKDESKAETGTTRKELERENGVYDDGVRRASDRSKVSRPSSHFQHDDRGTAGQNGRSPSRREDRGRGWWRDTREQQADKTTANYGQLKEDRARERKEDNRSWRHDGYFEMEANPNRERRRPAFREQKVSFYPEKTDKIASDQPPTNPRGQDVRIGRKDYTARNRSFERDREVKRTESWNSARERYDGGKGRDRFSGGQNYGSNGNNRAEKWKHDLYSEANRSPTPKNEEDHIAKVEALLSS